MKALFLSFMLFACASTPPPPQSSTAREAPPGDEPEPPPPASPAPSFAPPPPGYTPPVCELELSTVGTRRRDAFDVTARVKNLSKRPIKFELPDRCPSGPVVFRGLPDLPDPYDYYTTCTHGACMGPRDPVRYTVAPGETLDIESVILYPAGGNCNKPVPPGRYSIWFSLPPGVVTCNGKFASVERPGKPAPSQAPR